MKQKKFDEYKNSKQFDDDDDDGYNDAEQEGWNNELDIILEAQDVIEVSVGNHNERGDSQGFLVIKKAKNDTFYTYKVNGTVFPTGERIDIDKVVDTWDDVDYEVQTGKLFNFKLVD